MNKDVRAACAAALAAAHRTARAAANAAEDDAVHAHWYAARAKDYAARAAKEQENE